MIEEKPVRVRVTQGDSSGGRVLRVLRCQHCGVPVREDDFVFSEVHEFWCHAYWPVPHGALPVWRPTLRDGGGV